MLYTGRVAGVFYTKRGGGANYLCLPNDPQYYTIDTWHYDSRVFSSITGTEYERPIKGGRHNYNVPCAVCHATRKTTQLMIPAKTSCPSGWIREYYGYLETDAVLENRSRTEFICIDKSQIFLPATGSDINGATLHHVRATCHGINCPPYDPLRVLACTVCTN